MEFLNASKPCTPFDKLDTGYYEVIKFKLVKNRFYRQNSENPGAEKSLIVELANQVLFLPSYISKNFAGPNEYRVAELNNSSEKIFLYYGGSSERR